MSLQPAGYQQQLLYRADPNVIQTYKSTRDHLNNICRQHMNQRVRIETMDGQVITGRIVNSQGGLIYLAVSDQGGQRAFFGSPYYYGASEAILPLVLYELLVITLLYT